MYTLHRECTKSFAFGINSVILSVHYFFIPFMKKFKYSAYDSYTKQTHIFDTLGQAKQFIANSICGGQFISGLSLVK